MTHRLRRQLKKELSLRNHNILTLMTASHVIMITLKIMLNNHSIVEMLQHFKSLNIMKELEKFVLRVQKSKFTTLEL